MKKKQFILIACVLCSLLQTQNMKGQNKFVVKGGPSFSVIFPNELPYDQAHFWGGNVGIEKQLRKRLAFAATFEYLSSKMPTEEAVKKDFQNYNYYRHYQMYLKNSTGINLEFRFYTKKNPLVSLEGFFIEWGAQIGLLNHQRFVVARDSKGSTYYSGIESNISANIAPNLSFGGVIPINDDLSIDFSGGFKIGVNSHSINAYLPFTIRLRYTL